MKRKEVLCAVIGGVVGAVLVMAAGSIAPLGAYYGERDVAFGKITCTGIRVKRIGEDSAAVEIDVYGGDGGFANLVMRDASHNGKVEITARKGGAGVFVGRNDNHAGASITATEDGGEAQVDGARKSPPAGFPSGAYVKMGINENGGHVSVLGKGTDEARAVMAVNEYGNGAVSTWDKNGYRLATLE